MAGRLVGAAAPAAPTAPGARPGRRMVDWPLILEPSSSRYWPSTTTFWPSVNPLAIKATLSCNCATFTGVNFAVMLVPSRVTEKTYSPSGPR